MWSYRKFKCEPRLPILSDKKIIEIWKTVSRKKTWKWLVKHRSKIWSSFWWNVVIFPIIDARKKIQEYIVSITDVTDLEIARLQLQKSFKKLKELDIKKDEFLNIASHELRTPMTSIKWYVSMILDGDVWEISIDTRLYLQRVLESSNRLIALINDMLNIAKLEAWKEEFVFKTYDLKNCISTIVYDIQPMLLQKKQNLHIDISYDSFYYNIDADKLKQVLLNLVGNAIKFTPENGIITIKSYVREDSIMIHVIDTGIGIRPEEMKLIFEKFGQAKNSLTRNKGWTGLGLPIAKQIIEKMGGTLKLESEVDKWSDFLICFPVVQNNSKLHFSQK